MFFKKVESSRILNNLIQADRPEPEDVSSETKQALTIHPVPADVQATRQTQQMPLSESKAWPSRRSDQDATTPTTRQRNADTFVRLWRGIQKDPAQQQREKADKLRDRFLRANADPKKSIAEKQSMCMAAIKVRHDLANHLSTSQDDSEPEQVQLLEECVEMHAHLENASVEANNPLMEQVTARACSIYMKMGQVPDAYASLHQFKAHEMLARRHFFGGSLTNSELEQLTDRERNHQDWHVTLKTFEIRLSVERHYVARQMNLDQNTQTELRKIADESRDRLLNASATRENKGDGALDLRGSAARARLALLQDNSQDELKVLEECLAFYDQTWGTNEPELIVIVDRAYSLYSKLMVEVDDAYLATNYGMKEKQMLLNKAILGSLTPIQNKQLTAAERNDPRARYNAYANALRYAVQERSLKSNLPASSVAVIDDFLYGERNDSLHAYAKAGKLSELEALLAPGGVDIDQLDTDGYTPLMWAVQNGRLDMVKLLTAAGASIDLDVTRVGYESCLFLAVEGSRAEILEHLLKHECNPNWSRADGATPLRRAVEIGSADMVDQLLRAGADVDGVLEDGTTLLLLAARLGRAEVARLVLDRMPELINKADKNGRTPMSVAAEKDHLDLMLLLREKGGDANLMDSSGNTALTYVTSALRAAKRGWR